MSDKLRERFHRVCCQHVLPHVAKYREELTVENRLPLMEPRIFGAFAYQACCDAAALVMKLAQEQYDHEGRNVPASALRAVTVDDGDEEKLRTDMLCGIADFNNALDRFSGVLQRFHQMAARTPEAAWHNGIEAAGWGAELFGGLTGIIAGVVRGFAAGAAIDRKIEAEAQLLQQEFIIMLQAYDKAMDIIIEVSVETINLHHKKLLAAVRKAR